MQKTSFPSVLAAACVVALTACKDPSADVHRTTAADADDSVAASVEGGRVYELAAGSTIGFIGSKVTGSHTGGFTNVTGSLAVADGRIVGVPEFTIDMHSTWSDSDRLTGHLKSPDFFGVEEHPVSTFTVASIEASDAGHQVTGNLNLHGVTKSITFPATVAVSDGEVRVNAEFAINRKDFNINYPGKPDDLIRDNVVIKLELVATPGEEG